MSSIILSRGLLGGLLAALAAFLIYQIIAYLFKDYIGAKLISLMVLGGILGSILVTVITALEDFELEYISPQRFKNTVPISKWLKSGIDIFIGTDSGCYVYIKWNDDAVQPQHGRLLYENGAVYIQPLAETMVNGVIIPHNRKMALQNGDIIQLGRASQTRMRYKEKRKDRRPGGPQRRSSNGEGKAPDQDKKEVRFTLL